MRPPRLRLGLRAHGVCACASMASSPAVSVRRRGPGMSQRAPETQLYPRAVEPSKRWPGAHSWSCGEAGTPGQPGAGGGMPLGGGEGGRPRTSANDQGSCGLEGDAGVQECGPRLEAWVWAGLWVGVGKKAGTPG